MRRLVSVLLVSALLAFSFGITVSAGVHIAKFVLCEDVEEHAHYYTPIGITNVFSSDDDYAYCFFEIWVDKPSKATLKWYAPDGTLYQVFHSDTLQDGYTWYFYRTLKINGTKAASLPGKWTVELTVEPPVALTPAMGGFSPKKLTTTFYIKEKPKSAGIVPPPTVIPPALSPTPSPTVSPGTWQVGKYSLSIADVLKCQYFHDIAHVTLFVESPNLHKWTLVQDVEVDTGSFETILPIDVADALGIDAKAGKRIQFRGVTGNEETGWEYQLTIGVMLLGGGGDTDGYILGKNGKPYLFTIPIIFYGHETDNTASKLLGRKGVLSVLNLKFGERMLTIALQSK